MEARQDLFVTIDRFPESGRRQDLREELAGEEFRTGPRSRLKRHHSFKLQKILSRYSYDVCKELHSYAVTSHGQKPYRYIPT